MSKPNLLYLSPVVPAVTGNGLAMRAGLWLEVLAQQYSIYLLVIPLYGSGQPIAENMAREAGQAFQTIPFDVVHVFRLYMAPFARLYVSSRRPGRPQYQLDLDD